MKMNRLDKINNQPKSNYIMQHKLTKNQEEKINGFLNVGYKVYFSCPWDGKPKSYSSYA